MGSNTVQLFLVEAKVSKSEFIERIKLKGVETYTVDNNYSLLLEPSTIFEHKVLFVNGGEDSKAWVMHGGDSPKKSERDACYALKRGMSRCSSIANLFRRNECLTFQEN